jgi:hypothetical protein
MQKRSRFKNSTTPKERLVAEAKALREEAHKLPPGFQAGQLAAESPAGRHRSRYRVMDKLAGSETADLAK